MYWKFSAFLLHFRGCPSVSNNFSLSTFPELFKSLHTEPRSPLPSDFVNVCIIASSLSKTVLETAILFETLLSAYASVSSAVSCSKINLQVCCTCSSSINQFSLEETRSKIAPSLSSYSLYWTCTRKFWTCVIYHVTHLLRWHFRGFKPGPLTFATVTLYSVMHLGPASIIRTCTLT